MRLQRLDEVVLELIRLGRTELLLRVAILLAPVLVLVAAGAAGSVPVWATVLGVLLGVLTMLAPDSEAGTLTALYLLAVWYVADQDSPYSIWTLVAALALLVFHVATSAATRAPGTGRLPEGSLPRWVIRTALVAGVTVAAYVVGWAFAALNGPGSAVLTTAAAVVAVLGLLAARRWTMAAPR